ncbi:MAG: hypothetical protein WAV40_00185 [Microgenomates group bacterium]
MHPKLEQFSDNVASAIKEIDQMDFPVTLERILTVAKLQLSVLEHIARRYEIFNFVVEVVEPLGYIVNQQQKFDLPPLPEVPKSSIEIPLKLPTVLARQPDQRVERKGSRHQTTSRADNLGDHLADEDN